MTTPTPKPRWFHPTPSWLIVALLVVEGLLWLSDRFQWPTWHKGYAVLIAVAAVGVVFVVMLLWLVVALGFRVRFQFSIRLLLILTVVVAIPFSWLAVEMKAAKEQQEAVKEIGKLGGSIEYDWEDDASGVPNAPGPEWLRKLLGDDFFGAVVGDINGREFTDEGLAHLAGLTRLHWLIFNNTQITDAGLANLAGLTQLQQLSLNDTQITDGGLAHLAGLNQLHYLNLDGTQITDAGLKHLEGLTQLRVLYLNNTQITTMID